ncbi:MAG: trigger factor [Rhodothermales bacterium]
MQTDIRNITDVELEFELNVPAADLAHEINEAIRRQRIRTTLKGFRPGKVPVGMVKKMYGKALAYGVAEDRVQQAFRSEVLEGDTTYDVLGQPTITELDYEYEGDLRAVVSFGVRPKVEVKSLSKVKISKLVHEISDADVDKEIESLLAQHAELTPAKGPAKKDSYVIVDMQRLDGKKGDPIEGEKQENVPFLLSDENLMPELRKAVTGMKIEATKEVKLPGPEGEDDRFYAVTLKEVKIRELPELDDDMVKKVTNDQVETADELKMQIREQLEQGWEQRSREYFQSDAIEKLIDLHEFDVPNSVIEMYLDAYVNDIKSKNDDALPEGFDEKGYRERRRKDAENQARWMFIRDAIMAEQKLEVTDEDRDEHFDKMAAQGGFTGDMMKSYYQSMPQLMDQVDQGILSTKVFGWLESQMKVTEKDKKAYEKEMKDA